MAVSTTLYRFLIWPLPGVDGESAFYCGDCCPANGDGGQVEGHSPGYGDDTCETCGVPDWEDDEEEGEE